MAYYPDFDDIARDRLSFRDRIGEPDESDAAIGRIALGFSYLEDTARNVILLLAAQPTVSGRILVAQLSFRQKVDALGAMFRAWADEHSRAIRKWQDRRATA